MNRFDGRRAEYLRTATTDGSQIPEGLLRLREWSGKTGAVVVRFQSDVKFTTAMPVNRRGEKAGEPLRITGGN